MVSKQIPSTSFYRKRVFSEMLGFSLPLIVLLVKILSSDAYVPAVVRPDKESVYKWKYTDTQINLIDFAKPTEAIKVPVPVTRLQIGKVQKCFNDEYPTPNNNLPRLDKVLTIALTCMAKILFNEKEKLYWIEFSGNRAEMKEAKYRKYQLNMKGLREEVCLGTPTSIGTRSQVIHTVLNNIGNPVNASLDQSQYTGKSNSKIKTYSSSTQYEYSGGFDLGGLFEYVGGSLKYTYTTENYEQSKNVTTETTETTSSITDTYVINPGELRKFHSSFNEMKAVTTMAIPIEVEGFVVFSLLEGSYQGKKQWILPVTELAKLFNVFQLTKNNRDKVMVILTLLTEKKFIQESSKRRSLKENSVKVVELCQEMKERFSNEDEM